MQVNDNRYSLFGLSMNTFNCNINEINRTNKIDRDKHKNYKLTDEIKKKSLFTLLDIRKGTQYRL